jgi:hypothetical protein
MRRFLILAALALPLAGCQPAPIFSAIDDARSAIEDARDAIKRGDLAAAQTALTEASDNLDQVECFAEECQNDGDTADNYRAD